MNKRQRKSYREIQSSPISIRKSSGENSMTPHMTFEQPPALDLLTEFRKKLVALAERRTAELRADIETAIDADRDRMLREGKDGYDHRPEIRAMIHEYESLRYFEQELNRVIRAFMDDATKPWRDAYASVMMQNYAPFVITDSSNASEAHATSEDGK